MAVLSWCPTITEWMMDVQWTMTLWGIYTPPLITMTSAVSLPPFRLELILSVGGTFSDVLSQTDHNCFFIIVACCSTAKTWQTWKSRRGDHFTLHITKIQTKTHTHFLFAVSPVTLVLSMASPPVVESASREHQDYALPENLPVHPTKSICSDLWCWAAPQYLHTAGELLDLHTFLFGWMADCCLSLSCTYTHLFSQFS